MSKPWSSSFRCRCVNKTATQHGRRDFELPSATDPAWIGLPGPQQFAQRPTKNSPCPPPPRQPQGSGPRPRQRPRRLPPQPMMRARPQRPSRSPRPPHRSCGHTTPRGQTTTGQRPAVSRRPPSGVPLEDQRPPFLGRCCRPGLQRRAQQLRTLVGQADRRQRRNLPQQ